MGDTSYESILPGRVIHKYGNHDLQTLSIWPLEPSALYEPLASKIWIIYIHGGAWRDPTITNTSFIPAITSLLSDQVHSTLIHQHVAAFASLDYRLSTHPDHSQDPTSTPSTALRNAVHPDHINDILTGVHLLQDKYSFGSNYVLVGHSCGATLALQTLMRKSLPGAVDLQLSSPRAIVGVCGIYDLKVMIANHESSPWAQVYKDFVTGAFGKDGSVWDAVSPWRYEEFEKWGVEGRKLVVLASSRDDELIEKEQAEIMGEKIGKVGSGVHCQVLDSLTGAHDDVWLQGTELARAIASAVGWIGKS